MKRQASASHEIRLCIDRCFRAKDGRGPWQAEKACYEALEKSGSQSVARGTAAVARRIGEWLKTAGGLQA